MYRWILVCVAATIAITVSCAANRTVADAVEDTVADTTVGAVEEAVDATDTESAAVTQNLASRLDTLVPGEWRFDDHQLREDAGIDVREYKMFRFDSNGDVYLLEGKKGQSAPILKEDWEFESRGTYDFSGDTIKLNITRFTAVRQNFSKGVLDNSTGEVTWHDQRLPTYDSTLTDGSQDRHITYENMIMDFSRQARFPPRVR